jgi:hypothetical protein
MQNDQQPQDPIPFRNLRLYQFDKSSDLEELLRKYFFTRVGNFIPALRIFQLVSARGHRPDGKTCRTVVVEDEYVDSDHFAAYNQYYSRSYLPVAKTTVRLHFFSSQIEKDDLPNLEKHATSYLGFSVVRPTEAYKVGRTVISPSEMEREEHILGQSDFAVNLSGSSMKVRGVPFMEQDTQIAACATACLWMASEAMSGRYGTPRFRTTEITELATKFALDLGAAVPSPGLSVPQLLEAIRAMGFSPFVYRPQSAIAAKQLLYWYVESEIPVIALLSLPDGTDGHTVTVIGHGYKHHPDLAVLPFSATVPDLGTQVRNVDWIPYFVAHDDQGGPYRRLVVLSDITYDIPRLGSLPVIGVGIDRSPSMEATPHPSVGWIEDIYFRALDSLVVPLPGPFSVDAECADRRARRLIQTAKRFLDTPDINEIVLRTYLIPSNELKRRLDPSVDLHSFSGMPERLARYYRSKPLPRFIWVTEISRAEWMNEPLDQRLIEGEIIIDPYSSPHGLDFVFLHVPGYLAELSPQSDSADDDPEVIAARAIEHAFVLDEDCPYTQLTRATAV